MFISIIAIAFSKLQPKFFFLHKTLNEHNFTSLKTNLLTNILRKKCPYSEFF